MNPTNFGGITGTIVSRIAQRNPKGSFTVTEFRVKPVGSSDEDSAIPLTAYNGIGNNILSRYNQGDTISVTYRLLYKTWETENGERRSRMEVVLTDSPITVRLGEASRAQRVEAESNKEVVATS
jgi:single-stranded DNA-binding protein